MEASNVQVCFAQLLSPTATAAIADGGSGGVAAVVGAWWSHLMVGGGHIRLLQNKQTEDIVRIRMAVIHKADASDIKVYNDTETNLISTAGQSFKD